MGATVRVVVVTYDSAEVLPTFLESLAGATTEPFDVVVVDNHLPSLLPEGATDVTVLNTGANLGYGRGANIGAEDFHGDWLVIANPDVVWDGGALDELLAAGERWPQAGCVGPAIRTVEGKLYPSARAFPSLGRGLGHALFGWFWPSNPWTRAYRAEGGRPEEGPTGWLSGSLMLVRREAWEQVGGFDARYFMYCEDMDLCRRLAESGWLNVYAPAAKITHVGGHSTQTVARRMLREHHRALYRYLSDHHQGWRWAPLRWLLALGLTVRYLVAARLPAVAKGAAPTRSAELLGH
ncbi:MAG TPA: glycosyltransferase family 2 protein [Mycobacteriales bacterium]|nr:glycosyltransferase family 2 protein [Mycobacteriales bacterium]